LVFRARYQDGNNLRDIVAHETGEGNNPVRTIMAERGEIITRPETSEVVIRLYDGSISDAQDASVQSIQFETYEFPNIGQEDIDSMRKKMRNKTLAELLISAAQQNLARNERTEVWSSFHQRISFAFGSFIFVL